MRVLKNTHIRGLTLTRNTVAKKGVNRLTLPPILATKRVLNSFLVLSGIFLHPKILAGPLFSGLDELTGVIQSVTNLTAIKPSGIGYFAG